MEKWTMDEVADQTGKVMIVTGANVGLGYETALALAKKNATVIMACRNAEKAERARQEILKQAPSANLEVIPIDLSSLKSVRSFALNFLKKYKRLDVLINNAGIMIPPFSKTEDGFESQMGANYFGHFLLTGLLLQVLNSTANARVVNLSSIAHENGIIDLANLHAEVSYSKMGAYGQSKLACLMHALELQRSLEKSGSKTIAVAAHPGVSNTDLARHIPKALIFVLMPFISLFSHKPEKAALPTLMAALKADVAGGEYFGPAGFRGMKGNPAKVVAKPHAYDEVVSAKLWAESERLTGIKYSFA